MRTIQILLSLFIIIGSFQQAGAQETAYFDDVRKDIDIAKELYNKGKYVSTYRQFEKIQERVEPKSELYSEAEYDKMAATPTPEIMRTNLCSVSLMISEIG